MRTFHSESAAGRKVVVIEVRGTKMRVTQKAADGTSKQRIKELASETEAQSESDQLARDLLGRGYVEQAGKSATKKKRTTSDAGSGVEEPNVNFLFERDEEPVEAAGPLLPRMAPAPAAKASESAPNKKKGSGKKKGKKGGSEDELDKRVLAGAGLAAVVFFGFLGYVAYDAFLKPPSIVGTWAGSMIDFEIGKPIIHNQYRLVLDDNKRASLTLQDKFTSTGTYTLQGDRLTLALKDEEGAFGGGRDIEEEPAKEPEVEKKADAEKKAEPEKGAEEEKPADAKKEMEPGKEAKPEPAAEADKEGDDEKANRENRMAGGTDVREYKVALGRATLNLYDPSSGKLMVQLLRFKEKPVVGGPAAALPAAPPKDLAANAGGEVDKAADERLVSVEFSPKDGAFRLRYPTGWTPDTGSRPDNTYSWGTFTHGSTKVSVFADIQGSLMSGSDSAQPQEEGSPLAPVHRAHELYKKTASEEYSEYKESEPTLFKGSGLGEGRIAAFSASTGGLLGSRVKGYRVTLLSRDRRVSILCHCPVAEFDKQKATFLALCRSLGR